MRAVITILLASLALAAGAQIYDGISIKKVTRHIDLTTQLSRQVATIVVSNTGSSSTSDIYLAFESQLAQHLSILDVFDESSTALEAKKSDTQSQKDKSFVLYRVTLGKALAPGATVDLRVQTIFTHTMTAFPTQISQFEKQLVRYHDNHYFSSPYAVQSQTTVVKVASAHIESKSELSPTSTKGDTITYGPYEAVQPYQYSELAVHFENNAPFLTVTKLQKDIEISHYGNIAIEETYNVQHDGAKLKGVFSRYDYQRSQGHAPAHIPMYTQELPLGAADVYYRDEIGNISTSHVNYHPHGATLELVPRFPLFGGWKFGFYMGYNLPTEHYLFTDTQRSSTYVLNITFATNFGDVAIDELVVRIIMPEGASNVEVFTPFPIDGKSSDTHYTYLDTTGRPVLVVTKKNVVTEHNRYFQVTYTFSQLSMLQEPFLLIVVFFLFFLFIMIYVRMEFTIGPVRPKRVNTERIDEVLLRAKEIVDQRFAQHEGLDESLNKAIKSKDAADYNGKRARMENTLATLNSKFLKVIVDMEELDVDLARRLREIERKEAEKSVNQQQLHDTEISHRIRKNFKGDYDTVKARFEKLYSSVDEELTSLVSDVIDNL